MPRVSFTENLQRHVACPPQEVTGDTVRAVLDSLFVTNARARGYVVDETGALRQHVAVFVNGRPVRDRRTLADEVAPRDEIYVMQALSGG